MGLFSRGRVPLEVKALIPKKERLMAWGSGPPRLDGTATFVAATDAAFYAPGYFSVEDVTDGLPWDRFIRAAWEPPILEAVITDGRGGWTLLRVTLDNPGTLPAVVHERVTASIVLSNHIDLVGRQGARLVARRVRGSDEIAWSVIFDAGLDPNDPELQANAGEALKRLRESAGI